jgi:hypothetical protein
MSCSIVGFIRITFLSRTTVANRSCVTWHFAFKLQMGNKGSTPSPERFVCKGKQSLPSPPGLALTLLTRCEFGGLMWATASSELCGRCWALRPFRIGIVAGQQRRYICPSLPTCLYLRLHTVSWRDDRIQNRTTDRERCLSFASRGRGLG